MIRILSKCAFLVTPGQNGDKAHSRALSVAVIHDADFAGGNMKKCVSIGNGC